MTTNNSNLPNFREKVIKKIKENWGNAWLTMLIRWLNKKYIKFINKDVYFYTKNVFSNKIFNIIKNLLILKKVLKELWYYKLFIDDKDVFFDNFILPSFEKKIIKKIKENWWDYKLIFSINRLNEWDIKIINKDVFFYAKSEFIINTFYIIEYLLILKKVLNEMWYYKLFINDKDIFFNLLYCFEEWYDSFWFNFNTKKHILTKTIYNLEWFSYPKLDKWYQVTLKFWKYNFIDWYNIFWFNVEWIHKATKNIYDEYWFNFNDFNCKWVSRINWEKYDNDWYDLNWYDITWFNINWFNEFLLNKDTWTMYDINWYNIAWFNDEWIHNETGTIYELNWYNSKWEDKDWYNVGWFNIGWIHRDTWIEYDLNWYNQFWYNLNLLHKNTNTKFDNFGYDIDWINKNTWTKYNKEWYDEFWYDIDWFNFKWYHINNNLLKIKNSKRGLIYKRIKQV